MTGARAFVALAMLVAAPVSAHPFTCAIQPDGKSVKASIANPFKTETHCTVNCQFSTTKAGTSFQVSCTRTVTPGGEAVELCTRTFESGRLVKMTGGDGNCIDPTPAVEPDDDEDVDAETLSDPEKLRKMLPPEGQRLLDQMRGPQN